MHPLCNLECSRCLQRIVWSSSSLPVPFVVLPSVRLSAVPASTRSSALTLACDLDGYYPEELSVSWVQNGTTLPRDPASEPNPDGTFRTTRYLTLTPEQREQAGRIQCVAEQQGALEPAQVLASLEDLDPPGTTTPSRPTSH